MAERDKSKIRRKFVNLKAAAVKAQVGSHSTTRRIAGCSKTQSQKQAGRLANRQTDWQTDRQTGKQKDRLAK